jgi:WD40 repeat protein
MRYFLYWLALPLIIGCSEVTDVNFPIVETLPDGTSVIVFRGHRCAIYSAVFSPDGKKIVTASGDGTARIWNVESGKELKRLQTLTNSPMYSVDYSPDGKKIITGHKNRTAYIWDVESGKELVRLDGHTHPVVSSSFSPDGKLVVTGSRFYSVRIWDVESGTELYEWDKNIYEWDKHDDLIANVPFINNLRDVSLSFSPDGSSLAMARGNKVLMWSINTKKELLKIEVDFHRFKSVNFSPDGKRIITASMDIERNCVVQIWDVESGKGLQTIEVDAKGLTLGTHSTYATYSPDGKKIASSGYLDKTIRIWDAVSGKELQRFDFSSRSFVNFVDFSPDGKKIITNCVDILMWNLEK